MVHMLAVQTRLPFSLNTVVNVASVSQPSPFRYPGGKTWLIPQTSRWLMSLPVKPKLFIEPFAGGAITGLTVAFAMILPIVFFWLNLTPMLPQCGKSS